MQIDRRVKDAAPYGVSDKSQFMGLPEGGCLTLEELSSIIIPSLDSVYQKPRRQTMKKITVLLAVLALFVALTVTGCGECKHRWMAADCANPKICSECKATDGEPLGHTWTEADCANPKTCSLCKETSGEPLGHTWIEATCTTPKTCSVCQETSGEPMEHTWIEATCQSQKTCFVCKETSGDVLPHNYLSNTVRQPSCSGDGLVKHSCQACGDSYEEVLPATTYTPTAVYDLYLPSLGEIITYDSAGNEMALGTCFVYTADGQLVTNYHVIENAKSAKVTIDGNTYDIQYVLAYDKDIDLAILKINATGLKPAVLCDKVHSTGGVVFAFGSSRGLTYTLSQGIITHSQRDIDGVLYIQHDAAISGGNSGGPLINEFGEVIGINTMTIRDSQNLNFAICTQEIQNLIYGDPLTMEQFYEKECNPFLVLKNYIIENGTYFSEDGGGYRVLLGADTSDSGTKFTRYAFYYQADNTITLDILVNDGQYWLYITLDESLDGVYYWDYFDENNYEMGGTINAATFTGNTLLGYSYNNIDYSELRSEIRKLASNMVTLLLVYTEMDLSELGITPASLGFTAYGG